MFTYSGYHIRNIPTQRPAALVRRESATSNRKKLRRLCTERILSRTRLVTRDLASGKLAGKKRCPREAVRCSALRASRYPGDPLATRVPSESRSESHGSRSAWQVKCPRTSEARNDTGEREGERVRQPLERLPEALAVAGRGTISIRLTNDRFRPGLIHDELSCVAIESRMNLIFIHSGGVTKWKRGLTDTLGNRVCWYSGRFLWTLQDFCSCILESWKQWILFKLNGANWMWLY